MWRFMWRFMERDNIELSGLGLNGTLGYLLSDLMSLKKFDLSDNNIHDTIPYQLPPNLTSLSLASNKNLSGNLPYSISAMVSLNYLNVSHNAFSLSIGDIFARLADLGTLDLSFNNFSGDLPGSFGPLSNISSLFLQNNQLTGSLNVLVGLPLDTLYDGNSFDNGPAPPTPPLTLPPPGRSHNNDNHDSGSGSHNKTQGSDNENSGGHKGLTSGAIVGIILGSVFVAVIVLLALVFCIRKQKRKEKCARTSSGSLPLGIVNGARTEGKKCCCYCRFEASSCRQNDGRENACKKWICKADEVPYNCYIIHSCFSPKCNK